MFLVKRLLFEEKSKTLGQSKLVLSILIRLIGALPRTALVGAPVLLSVTRVTVVHHGLSQLWRRLNHTSVFRIIPHQSRSLPNNLYHVPHATEMEVVIKVCSSLLGITCRTTP